MVFLKHTFGNFIWLYFFFPGCKRCMECLGELLVRTRRQRWHLRLICKREKWVLQLIKMQLKDNKFVINVESSTRKAKSHFKCMTSMRVSLWGRFVCEILVSQLPRQQLLAFQWDRLSSFTYNYFTSFSLSVSTLHSSIRRTS